MESKYIGPIYDIVLYIEQTLPEIEEQFDIKDVRFGYDEMPIHAMDEEELREKLNAYKELKKQIDETQERPEKLRIAVEGLRKLY